MRRFWGTYDHRVRRLQDDPVNQLREWRHSLALYQDYLFEQSESENENENLSERSTTDEETDNNDLEGEENNYHDPELEGEEKDHAS